MNARAPGVVEFHRPARVHPEPLDPRPVTIAAPPTVPQESQGSMLQVFFPMVGSATMVGFAILYNNRLFLYIALGVAALMLSLGIAMRVQAKRSVKKRRRENARKYRAYLADMQTRLAERVHKQHEFLLRLFPGIEGVWSIVNERRFVWERRPWDPDFMCLRLGLGTIPLAAPISFDLADDPLVTYERDLLHEADLVFERYKSLTLAPVTIDARRMGPIAVIGEQEVVRSWTRSALITAATHHAPDDLRIMAYFPHHTKEEWGWLKWVPHTRGSIEPLDDAHQSVALAVDKPDFEVLLSQLITGRIEHVDRLKSERRTDDVRFQQVIVVVDDLEPSGVTGLDVYEEMLRRATEIGVLPVVLVADPDRVPTTVGARVQLQEGGWLSFIEAGPEGRRESDVRADSAGVDICEAIARALAPLRLRVRESRTRQVDSEGLLDLLHLGGPHAITTERWRKTTPELLSTPIGIGEDGSQVTLDLKESAEDGMGPHGLIVGATGSGKSELLRTLVTGLAVGHSPDDLAMVLVDFKGGATFGELSRLPHTAGMITNIERDLTLVDRMHEALFGELERRQRLLQDAGNFDRVRDYQEHRREHIASRGPAGAAAPGPALPPLPSLLVIIDEFGELLAHKPDFIDLFVSMGRTGRSLGVHLLLATQRLETGRIRGLESHLRYRICLRTFSPEESQEVLGMRDAFELPPLPGLGYLSVDGRLRQFKAALSTRPYREYRDLEAERPAPGVVRSFSVTRDGGEIAVVGEPAAAEETGSSPAETHLRSEMQVCVDRLEELVGSDERARQVWLPPLPAAMTLDEIVDPDKREDRAPGGLGWLEAEVGLQDRPREQIQMPMTVGFDGREGHRAVVGAPRSGKSTLLQTLVSSLALTHDPTDLQIYGLDFGGGAMHLLAGLPHVGAVYSRSERAEVARLVREMRAIVDNRTELFRRHHIASMSEFHAKRRVGEVVDEYGEVFLVVDNWALLAQEFDELQYELTELAGSCLHYGVHLIISSNRWMDIRMNLRDNIGGRVELRLNDPTDSEIDRKVAKTLPDNIPGRGLGRGAVHFHAALPRIDGRPDISGLNAGVTHLVERASERWQDAPSAPPIRMLPAVLRVHEIAPRDASTGVLLGVEEFRLEPVHLDLVTGGTHLLVYGDGECGKTNLLKVVLEHVEANYTPKELRVVVVDYRRTLLERATSSEHVVAFTYTPEMTTQLASEIAVELRKRMPAAPASLTSPVRPTEWEGPRILLLIDDYDLVATPSGNPLAVLVDMVPQARDVGLHVVLTRRVSGTARGSFEPFYQRLAELGAPGLLMNGDPQEGPIIGGQKAEPLVAGRGYLVANRRSTLIQTVLAGDTQPEPPGVAAALDGRAPAR